MPDTDFSFDDAGADVDRLEVHTVLSLVGFGEALLQSLAALPEVASNTHLLSKALPTHRTRTRPLLIIHDQVQILPIRPRELPQTIANAFALGLVDRLPIWFQTRRARLHPKLVFHVLGHRAWADLGRPSLRHYLGPRDLPIAVDFGDELPAHAVHGGQILVAEDPLPTTRFGGGAFECLAFHVAPHCGQIGAGEPLATAGGTQAAMNQQMACPTRNLNNRPSQTINPSTPVID